MELEVAPPPLPPPPPMDFLFHSNCSSPSSTHHHHHHHPFFFSAPASPSSSLPPSPPPATAASHDQDFEFDFSGHLQRTSLSADELFHAGKIRPFKPPPSPPSSSTISKDNNITHNPKDSHSHSSSVKNSVLLDRETVQQPTRGRSGRASSFSYSSEHKPNPSSFSSSSSSAAAATSNNMKSSHASFLSSLSFARGYRKWRLKDFLLFRSASEGRAAGKDGLRKYSVLAKKAEEEEVRNSSFRSTESFGSVSSRRRGPVSAHELHYTVNRAASEELKKKTVLPYKKLGPLGCLGFNPTPHRITS